MAEDIIGRPVTQGPSPFPLTSMTPNGKTQ
jgi:hypothetical protein